MTPRDGNITCEQGDEGATKRRRTRQKPPRNTATRRRTATNHNNPNTHENLAVRRLGSRLAVGPEKGSQQHTVYWGCGGEGFTTGVHIVLHSTPYGSRVGERLLLGGDADRVCGGPFCFSEGIPVSLTFVGLVRVLSLLRVRVLCLVRGRSL